MDLGDLRLSTAHALVAEALGERLLSSEGTPAQYLQALIDGLCELSLKDPLTGLHNRRYFNAVIESEIDRVARTGEAALLLMIDIDRFKQVNDDHGHLVGDRVLQNIAGILRTVAGAEDVPCRLGGDEFCLLVMAESREEVLRYAEFVIATTRSLLRLQQAVPTICAVSIGACLVEHGQDWNDWYARADAALYESKRQGGNRVSWIDGDSRPDG